MTTKLRLTKHHGLGNDFLIALERHNPGFVPTPALARALCGRHRGVGADGLVVGGLPTTEGADLTMTLLNADGSVAEISGNGIRCLGQAALRAQGRREGTIVIDAASGRRTLVATAGPDVATDLLSVEMGAIGPGPALAPLATARDALHRGTGDVGNPHLVLHLDSLDGVDAATEGPLLEAEVPGGVNVHFLAVTGPDSIELIHWERGAGITEACGSGATVSATLAHRWGLVGDRVRVQMPGGAATVEVGPLATLIGEAVHIADIDYELLESY